MVSTPCALPDRAMPGAGLIEVDKSKAGVMVIEVSQRPLKRKNYVSGALVQPAEAPKPTTDSAGAGSPADCCQRTKSGLPQEPCLKLPLSALKQGEAALFSTASDNATGPPPFFADPASRGAPCCFSYFSRGRPGECAVVRGHNKLMQENPKARRDACSRTACTFELSPRLLKVVNEV